MNKHRHLYFKGSTVIEVLIATTIVAFALTGLASLMTANVKNSAEADYRQAAAGIAQDKMELIRQRKTTVPWNGTGNFLLSPYTGTGCNASTVQYNMTFYVACTPASGSGDELAVTVKVCWPGTASACTAEALSTTVIQHFYNN